MARKKLFEDNWPNCQVPKISSNQVDRLFMILNSMSYFEELSHGNLSNKVRMTTFWDIIPKLIKSVAGSNPLTLLSPCWGPWKGPKALVLQVTWKYWSEIASSRCPGSSLSQSQAQNWPFNVLEATFCSIRIHQLDSTDLHWSWV